MKNPKRRWRVRASQTLGRFSRQNAILLGIAVALSVLMMTATDIRAAPNTSAQESQPRVARDDRFGDSADHVRIASMRRAEKDDRIVVSLVIDRGFHINANPASFHYLIPTTLTVTNRAPVRLRYPSPIFFKPKFSDERLAVYEGEIRITAEFAQGTLAHTAHLLGTVTVQACTDEICLPPADLPLPR